MQKDSVQIVEKLKEEMVKKGLKANELAQRTDLSYSVVHNTLSGKSNPRLDTLLKLAHEVNLKLDFAPEKEKIPFDIKFDMINPIKDSDYFVVGGIFLEGNRISLFHFYTSLTKGGLDASQIEIHNANMLNETELNQIKEQISLHHLEKRLIYISLRSRLPDYLREKISTDAEFRKDAAILMSDAVNHVEEMKRVY